MKTLVEKLFIKIKPVFSKKKKNAIQNDLQKLQNVQLHNLNFR